VQRVVLLPDEPDPPAKHKLPVRVYSQAAPEKVLVEPLGLACLIEEVRRQANEHKGRWIAGEWQDVRGHWTRFIWLRVPVGSVLTAGKEKE
jgi:hypothetical protein